MTSPPAESRAARDDPGTSPASSERRARFADLATVLLFAVAPLLPTLRAAFIYDDTTIIRDNVLLRGWSALGRVWTQPYWPSDGVDALGLYRPLQLALLATVWNATGGSALWMHIYALTLAALTAVGVWWMARRGAGAAAALTGAVWFAVHPLHVEAVASVANTSELVVVLCTVGMVWVLERVAPAPDRAARDWMRALLIGALAAAALLAKESGLLALPLAALTVWGWRPRTASSEPLGHFVRENVRVWLAAIVCVWSALLLRLVVLGAPVSHASIAAQGLGAFSVGERVRAMLSLWPRIVVMLAWPTSLSPYYGPSSFPEHRTALALASAIGAIALAVFAAVIARRGDRRPLVALGWIALTYFPASNLVAATGQILSDRTLFGATVGVALLLAWSLDCLPSMGRQIAIVLCAVVIARSSVVSARYAMSWTSHRALWTRMVAASPREHLGLKLLGMDARARGDTTRALAFLGGAFAMAPYDRQIRFEYGQILYATGRYQAAAVTLAPLIRDGDARSEPGFVALYLDAVGRAGGPQAVVAAATPLLHSETAQVAALFLGVAEEQLGSVAAADSAYSAGLRRRPADTVLANRRAALRAAYLR